MIQERSQQINLKFYNKLWQLLIQIKKKMMDENLSFSEAKAQMLSKDNNLKFFINKLNNLGEFYSLFKFIAYKEQFEAFINTDNMEDDQELKTILQKTSQVNVFDLLSSIRNHGAHYDDKIFLRGGKIFFKFEDRVISMQELKKSLYMSMTKGLLKNDVACKFFLSNIYSELKPLSSFSVSELKKLARKLRKLNYLKTISRQRDKSVVGTEDFDKYDKGNNIDFLDKYLIIFVSEFINKYMIENQNVKWKDILKKVKEIEQIPGFELLGKELYDNKRNFLYNKLLDIDIILYSQFIFSTCFDEQFDYEGQIESLQADEGQNKTFEFMRDAIMHSRIDLKKDNEIRFFDLTEQGEDLLKLLRKKRHRFKKRKISTEDYQTFLRDNPLNTKNNLEIKFSCSSEQLYEICCRLYDIRMKQLQDKINISSQINNSSEKE